MTLDFAIFEPNARQRRAIDAVASFCRSHDQPFTIDELIAHPPIGTDSQITKMIRDWLRDGRRVIVLDDLLLELDDAKRWRNESLLRESVHYYAFRLLPDILKKFGDRKVASDNKDFVTLVYAGRARLLRKRVSVVTPRLLDFIRERLSRCGLETVSADVPSISEIWDIFDDYEFQKLMGRIP